MSKLNDEEIQTVAYDRLRSYPYTQCQVRFLRLHLTREAALALVNVDIEAFKTRFPGLTFSESEPHFLQEMFADRGVIGCAIDITLDGTGTNTAYETHLLDAVYAWYNTLQGSTAPLPKWTQIGWM